MIGKHIANPEISASKWERINSLAKYIRLPQDGNRREKCIYTGSRGFITSTPDSQVAEMVALAQDCVKSKDPIAHYVLSLKAGEQPSTMQVVEWNDVFEAEMGMQGHQIIYGLHDDTVNMHVHILLNRVNPRSQKIRKINNGFDLEALHKVIARIEHAQGWQREVNGRYLVLENGDLAREHPETQKPSAPGVKKRDKENQTGEESAERIAIEIAGPILRSADNWLSLHQQLAAHQMRYVRVGSGAQILVNGVAVKASSADRNGSLSKLEKRLGSYAPYEGSTPAKPRIPAPLKASPHWNEYNTARTLHSNARQIEKQELQRKHAVSIRQLEEEQRERRLSVLGCVSWRSLSALRNAMTSVLASEQASQKLDAKDRRKKDRDRMAEKYPPWPCFETWLRLKDPLLAEEWRYRASAPHQIVGSSSTPITPRDIRGFVGKVHDGHVYYLIDDVVRFVDKGVEIDVHDWQNQDSLLAALQLARRKFGSLTVNGSNEFKAACVKLAALHDFKISNSDLQLPLKEAYLRLAAQRQEAKDALNTPQVQLFRKYHEAVNAQTYRVTSTKTRANGSSEIFLLDKNARGAVAFSPEEIEQKTPQMLRNQGRGECIYYTPLSSDKHHVLINDLTPEKLASLVEDGYKPATVTQISDANLQALITVPKIQTHYDKDIGNLVTKELNAIYGNALATQSVQPQPAPGYQNRNPKTMVLEEVQLLSAERIECAVTLDMCKKINASFRAKAAIPKASTVDSLPSELGSIGAKNASAIAAYWNHFKDISSSHTETIDCSRVDYQVALRMRYTGHSKSKVKAAIEVCAAKNATKKDSGRSWNDYAERAVRTAFGSDGDQNLRDIGKLNELDWKLIENNSISLNTPPKKSRTNAK